MSRSYRFITKNIQQEKYEHSESENIVLTESREPEIYFQLMKVLRARPGDEVILQPQKEFAPWFEYRYSVVSAKGKELELKFLEKFLNKNELKFGLVLVLCIPNRPDKLDFILQKAVELGVKDIVLVEGDFSQFKHQLKTERLEKIVREAAEQSERAIVPTVRLGGKLNIFLKSLDTKWLESFFTAMERDDNKTLLDLLPELREKHAGGASTGELAEGGGAGGGLQILIGPEGGFSEAEKTLIKELGVKSFSLGKRILRMETAAVLSLGIAAQM